MKIRIVIHFSQSAMKQKADHDANNEQTQFQYITGSLVCSELIEFTKLSYFDVVTCIPYFYEKG
uniref:Uncharacterized protein n=1 Tax=uncultured crenarchaeote 29d5 TaxID=684057 RepID=D4N6Y8_9CREN|nr:hypothetical protein 29d5orf26 [uncultured crenarchaeote 29d5]